MVRKHDKSLGPTQRQLRVAETIRHILADALQRGNFKANLNDLEAASSWEPPSITITEVRVSPDLHYADVFFMPLAGVNIDTTKKFLDSSRRSLRSQLAKKLATKFIPELRFIVDNSFDHAIKIQNLLKGL